LDLRKFGDDFWGTKNGGPRRSVFEELLRNIADVAAQKFKQPSGPTRKSVARLPAGTSLVLAPPIKTPVAPPASSGFEKTAAVTPITACRAVEGYPASPARAPAYRERPKHCIYDIAHYVSLFMYIIWS
jgi:hypothetical protein